MSCQRGLASKGTDQATVPHDSCSVGEPEDLVQPMGDVEHSNPASAENVKDSEKPVDIGSR